MDNKYLESIQLIKNFAKTENDIMGVLVLGSQVRKEFPGDKWSDLDLLLLVNETSKYIDSEEWMSYFGEVVCTSKEVVELPWINLIWYVKRILYSDNRTIEFSIEPYNKIDDVLEMNKEIHSLGYEIIYDKTNGYLNSRIKETILSIQNVKSVSINKNDFDNIINDILFHIIYAFKKIKRKELWVAVSEINCYIKDKLLQIIEIHNKNVNNKSNILMYEGRLLENRINNEIINMLEYCFTNYNESSAINALEAIINITYKICKDICRSQNFKMNEKQFNLLKSIFSNMKAGKN